MGAQFYGPGGADSGRLSGWKSRLELVTAIVTLVTAVVGLTVFFHSRDSSNAEPRPSTGIAAGAKADQVPAANVDPQDSESTGAAAAAAAQLRLPGEYLGTWRGIATQGSQKYLTVLHLKGGEAGELVGDSSYPPLDCTGKLTLISGGDDVIIREEATTGCMDIDLHLTVNDDGTMEYIAGEPEWPTTVATLVQE